MKIINLTTIDLVIVQSDLKPVIYIIEGPESLGTKKAEIIEPGKTWPLEVEE